MMALLADAESQVEEYERILSADIKIPAKKGYSAECRDLQSQVSTARVTGEDE